MPDESEWVHLYNPTQQAWHRVPDNAAVIQDFQDRGWETPDDSAARAEAEAAQLHGRALDEALDAAGLAKTGTVKEKQARLAEHENTPEATEATEDEGE
jgi:hypothetical protein